MKGRNDDLWVTRVYALNMDETGGRTNDAIKPNHVRSDATGLWFRRTQSEQGPWNEIGSHPAHLPLQLGRTGVCPLFSVIVVLF